MIGGIPYVTSVHYEVKDIRPSPQVEPIALYRFLDAREQVGPRRIGVVLAGRKQPANWTRIFAREPVAVTVTQAFMDGFKSRGFHVVDRTGEAFGPGPSQAGPRLAISGQIFRFWVMAYHGAGLADCEALVQLHEVTSGQTLWEKKYYASQQPGKALPPAPPPDALADLLGNALGTMITDAVQDPELLSHLLRP